MLRTVTRLAATSSRSVTLARAMSSAADKAAAVVPQASNRATTWSPSQKAKQAATTGPRFEQTNWDLQPNPPSAQELIQAVPIKWVEARRVSCDGGGGALGHPKVYINLDKDQPMSCGYCGLRFQQKHSDHHH
ncbi:zinc-finger domain-containing protein [Entophlyctis helioformis]|nr:zinc-finger domain-containing protein [Entophlyctis helioformis]